MSTTKQDTRTGLADALVHPVASTRLRAALSAGTRPDPALLDVLLDRCRTEPDFFVRDMLTWALTRHPASMTVPRLLAEAGSEDAQARSQALHTLAKVRDPTGWPAARAAVHDPDDEVARSAWRAAVVLVPPQDEAVLAAELASELGRGVSDTQLSLSRALVSLGEELVTPLLEEASTGTDPRRRAHAAATEELLRDPEGGFALATATRVVLTAGAPRVEDGPC